MRNVCKIAREDYGPGCEISLSEMKSMLGGERLGLGLGLGGVRVRVRVRDEGHAWR